MSERAKLRIEQVRGGCGGRHVRVKTVINRVVMDVPKVNLSSSSIPAKQAKGRKEMRKQASSAGLECRPQLQASSICHGALSGPGLLMKSARARIYRPAISVPILRSGESEYMNGRKRKKLLCDLQVPFQNCGQSHEFETKLGFPEIGGSGKKNRPKPGIP